MILDALFADIGSTKTLVSAYSGIDQNRPHLEGQGVAATTVEKGDVCIGLEKAIDNLKEKLDSSPLEWKTMMATCSAAGGLRMAAHGLVESMTSKAAREASLGAGAIIVSDTCGLLSEDQVNHIIKSSPKIILLAGGVDGGETEKVLENTKMLAMTDGAFSVIFAGNKSLKPEVKKIFADSKVRLFITENVYPAIDQLNITRARNLIHHIFEDHLIESPGMERIKKMVDGPVLPTPGAVMRASQILAGHIGDLVTVDVGGATTDIHSVTKGSPELQEILLNPEPDAKRTVEGDLGVYINAPHVFELLIRSKPELMTELNLPNPLPRFPKTEQEASFLQSLTKVALSRALARHVGQRKKILTFKGEKEVIEGKDLTAVKWVIGTGGGLTRLSGGLQILTETFNSKNHYLLLPKKDPHYLIDNHYIMAAAGLMCLKSPQAALKMMENSFGNC